MEKVELLTSLNDLLGRYRQHRAFIDKAESQANSGKFNRLVIEKVIRDHEARAAEVSTHVTPLVAPLRAIVATLEGERADIQAQKAGIDDHVQEAELRYAIGELSDEDLEAAVGKLRETLDGQNARIAAIDADLEEINGALQAWAAAAGKPLPPAPEPVREEPVAVAPPPVTAPDPEEDDVGPHAHRTEIREDVSAVFAAGMDAPAAEEEVAIETGENNEPVVEAPAANFGFEEDILSSDTGGSAEVEIDLGGAGPSPSMPSGPAAEKPGEAPRRALLLYQEGTAEEQIYPFTGDTLTIGRGRENDIQIKNDSKVSRYHCKLYRRLNNFYIEDAKSSNGTLVNGELITDRRLFGGEEVIIGETFFRFRIMD